MSDEVSNEATITLDDKPYAVSDLSDEAKAQLTNIHYVDAQLLDIQNKLSVFRTVRQVYINQIKALLEPADSES